MSGPSVYLYEQVMNGQSQIGVVGLVHVDDYESDIIRKHEKTRRDKEDDRTRHVLVLNAHAEPVFLTCGTTRRWPRSSPTGPARPPLYDFTAPDGVQHTGLAGGRSRRLRPRLRAHPARLRGRRAPSLCQRVARGGRAARVEPGAHRRRGVQLVPRDAVPVGRAPHPAVPSRGPRSRADSRPAEFVERLARGRQGDARSRTRTRPIPGSFAFYTDGAWYLLELDPATIPAGDPIRSLDAALLEERVLGPILGVGDIRTDKRVDFVGGIRGTAELERRVQFGRDGARHRALPGDGRSADGRVGCGRDHAAEDHVVRAEAAERAVRAYACDGVGGVAA